MGRRYMRTAHPAPGARSAAGLAPHPAASESAWQRRRSGPRSRVDLLNIGECPAMNQSEDRVRDESEDPNGDDGGDDAIRSEKSLRDQDEAADAALGRYDFGHDQVGPGPAHRDAQRIDHLREGGGQEYLVEDLPARGTKRVGDIEHLVRDTMSDVHHHQHELKEDANPDDDELFVFVEADEQDEQWDEGRRRHIADEVDRRLEERSHDL